MKNNAKNTKVNKLIVGGVVIVAGVTSVGGAFITPIYAQTNQATDSTNSSSSSSSLNQVGVVGKHIKHAKNSKNTKHNDFNKQIISYLGITDKQFKSDRKSHLKYKEIFSKYNKSVDSFISKMKDEDKVKLDKKILVHKLSQDQENKALSKYVTTLTKILSNK